MPILIVNHDGETKTQGKPIQLCRGGKLGNEASRLRFLLTGRSQGTTRYSS